MEKNYYDILEISRVASQEIVEKAYKMVYNKFITFINEGTFSWQRHTRFAKTYLLLHFVVFAHRSTTTPRSFASRRGKYFLCKLPWNLAAWNFGAGKAAGRNLTGRKSRTRTKHALKFQLVQACVLLSTEGLYFYYIVFSAYFPRAINAVGVD